MKVKELMSTNITCVEESTSVFRAAEHMRRENVGSLPVCDSAGHLKGIVTDRDLTLRCLARYDHHQRGSTCQNPLESLTCGSVMTKDPITVSPDTGIHDAALLFSFHKVRRLPVTEASRLIGILSLGDLAVKPVHIDEAGDALSAISLADGLQEKN